MRPLTNSDADIVRAGGPDVERMAAGAGPALDYLSRTARVLGIPDPVQEYFGPVVGRWRDLHEQAQRWRRAANAVEELGDRVTGPLGRLDAVWEGAVADSFMEHMRQVGTASRSVSDAMTAMAEVLDRTAEAVRQLVTDLIDLLSGGADRVSSAMILPADGEALAQRQLGEIRGYSRRVFDAVREILQAFVEMCDNMEADQPFAGVRVANAFPQQTWSFQPKLPTVSAPVPQPVPQPLPEAPAASTDMSGAGAPAVGGGGGGGGFGGAGAGAGPAGAGPVAPGEPALRTLAAEQVPRAEPTAPAGAGAAGAGAAGSGTGGRGAAGAPFMPMGMGMGGQGQDNEHKSKSRISVDPTELFGKPTKTAPPVIGED